MVLTGALLQGACTTPSGNELDCGEICSIAIISVMAAPCAVAAGVGCIAGGGTRCLEGAPPSEPAPEPAPTEAAPSSTSAAPMEF